MKLFEITYINNIRKNAFLLATPKGNFQFQVTSRSKLGHIDLKPILNHPRTPKKDDSTNSRIFTFHPKDRDQLKKVSKGNILELKE